MALAFTDAEQLAFARRVDGKLHARTGSRALRKSRQGNEALGDIRATMHRARPFDDATYRRDLRRVTPLDLERPLVPSGA
jgi:hypothetical protein